MLKKLVNLSRFNKQLILIVVDYIALVSVLLTSFSIRLGYWYFPTNEFLFSLVFVAPIIAIVIFVSYGLYRSVTRYIGLNAMWPITQGVTLYAILWGLAAFMLGVEGIPRSIVLLNYAFRY